MQLVAEPQEDRAMGFGDRPGAHAALLGHRAGFDRGYIDDTALAIDLDAVVPAGHAVAQIPAQGQARATMRATILECMDVALPVTPEHDVLTQPGDAQRRLAHAPARYNRVPGVAYAAREIGLDARLVDLGLHVIAS